jgi:hypothetical protein
MTSNPRVLRLTILVIIGNILTGCHTVSDILDTKLKGDPSVIRTDRDADVIAAAYSKEVELCEERGLQDCVYGLPFGKASEEGAKKLAMGICSAVGNYFYDPELAPCRSVCANAAKEQSKNCVDRYGYKLVFQSETGTIFLTNQSPSEQWTSPLKVVWGILEATDSWTQLLEAAARLDSGIQGKLRTLFVKNKDEAREFIILYEYERIGFIRYQTAPKNIDGQIFLAKSEEKYGKADRFKVFEPFSKMYRWAKLGKRQRFLGLVRGPGRQDTELGSFPGIQPALRLAANEDGPFVALNPSFRASSDDPDQIVSVILDVNRFQELAKNINAKIKLEKEKSNADVSKQKKKEVDSIKY